MGVGNYPISPDTHKGAAINSADPPACWHYLSSFKIGFIELTLCRTIHLWYVFAKIDYGELYSNQLSPSIETQQTNVFWNTRTLVQCFPHHTNVSSDDCALRGQRILQTVQLQGQLFWIAFRGSVLCINWMMGAVYAQCCLNKIYTIAKNKTKTDEIIQYITSKWAIIGFSNGDFNGIEQLSCAAKLVLQE